MSETIVTIILGEQGFGKTFTLTKLLQKYGSSQASYVDINKLQHNNIYSTQP